MLIMAIVMVMVTGMMAMVMLAMLHTLIVEVQGTRLHVMSQRKRNETEPCRSPRVLSWAAQLRTSAPSSQCPVECDFARFRLGFELW